MKRLMSAGLSTLILSALVTPTAQAIRPELLPKPNQQESPDPPQSQPQPMVSSMPSEQQRPASTMEQPKPTDPPPFEYFEHQYLERYGS